MCIFIDNSTAGNAAITNASGAVVDFSASTGPAGDNKLTAGSIAGAGSFLLGANELTVGGNNLSTDVSGVISGTGSLVKVGAGTLTLSGNANLGGTTIDGGTLAVNGGTLNASNTIVVGSTAGSSGTLNIGAGGGASTQNLIVGQSGVGTLAVQNGGTLTDFGGFVGDLPGSQGTATVSGAGSTWTNTDTIQVGGLGTGTLTIAKRRYGEQWRRRLHRIVCRLDWYGDGDRPGLHLEQQSRRRAQYRQFWHGHAHDRERWDGHQ